MKVVYPYAGTRVGGSVVSGALAAGPLQKLGVECEGVFPGEGPAVEVFRRHGIPVAIKQQSHATLRRLHQTSTLRGKLKALPALMKQGQTAYRYLRRRSPDLVHINGDQTMWTWGIPARMQSIPVVWHVRQERGRPWMDRLRARLSAYIFFVADANRVRLENVGTLPPHRTVYNCVDSTRFYPPDDRAKEKKRQGFAEEAVTVGFVGNLVARKRPEWAVRAILDLRRDGENIDLVVVGADFGDGSRRAALEREAQEAGATSHVHFLGYRDDVADLMRAFDVLVLPSEAKGEAFPRVVVEAMTSGAAVVATRVAGVPEAVCHGHTGLLADPHRYGDFKDQLARMVQEASLRERLTSKAREVATERFAPDQVRDQIAEVYAQIAEISRGAA